MKRAAKEYLKEPYARMLIPDEGSFAAEILEFPGCFAEGDSPNEAFANLEEAAEEWIEACLDQGQEIPEPFVNQGFGGKIALRLPRSMHRQAAQMAERDGVSLNHFLVSAIASRIGAEDLYNKLVESFEIRIANTAQMILTMQSPLMLNYSSQNTNLTNTPTLNFKGMELKKDLSARTGVFVEAPNA